MSEQQQEMMLRIQQLGFTMNDLAIYLDTHLYDGFAIDRYETTAAEYRSMVEQYTEAYGPLNLLMPGSNEEGWAWALQDFPWDY